MSPKWHMAPMDLDKEMGSLAVATLDHMYPQGWTLEVSSFKIENDFGRKEIDLQVIVVPK